MLIPDKRTVASNQEQETYVDSLYSGGLVNPFSTSGAGVTITADNIGSIMPKAITSLTNNWSTNGKALATGVDTTWMNASQRYVIDSTNASADALYIGERGNITILSPTSFEYNLGSNPGANAAGSCSVSFMMDNTSVTSGLLTTEHSFSQGYGLVEYRGVKLPGGRGVWPALWELPVNQQVPEVDGLENYGGVYGGGIHQPFEGFHTLHYLVYAIQTAQVKTSYLPPNAFTGTNNFAIVIDRRFIAIYVNDSLAAGFANIDPITGQPIVTNADQMYILMNLAVSTLSGGSWTTADFPQSMTVGEVLAYAPLSGF